MTYQDAVSELVRLWDLLPLLVGSPWQELEPSLLDALDNLVAAQADDDREQRAAQVLRLCLAHEMLRQALKPAILRDENRGGQPGPVGWRQTGGEITAVIERSSRPGGDQWLAASIEDHLPGRPLRAGRGYTLAISVAGDGPPADALAAGAVPPWAELGTTLTVEVRGVSGADIETIEASLTLPWHGPSPDRARFLVTPRAGTEQLTLNALITRDHTFVQLLTVTLRVDDKGAEATPAEAHGAGDAVRALAGGYPLAAARAAQTPYAHLLLRDKLLTLTVAGSYTMEAELPFSQGQLEEIAKGPRAALEEIANGVSENGPAAHQVGVDIPLDVYQESLAELVTAGKVMFNTLFFGPDASAELKRLGAALRDLDWHDGPLWLVVVGPATVIPWHLLAFPAPAAAGQAGAASQLLGLRHPISYLSARGSWRQPRSRSLRPDDGPLRVVLAVNEDIDVHDGSERDLAAGQVATWRLRADTAAGALSVAVPPVSKILDVLVDSRPPGELLYFFCHANVGQHPGRLTPTAAFLEFSGRHQVSIRDLIGSWPADHELDAAPLVVLNACGSAVATSSVYSSFLPYLLGHGARGVIGTEASVPTVFAAAWAHGFFERVLDGMPLTVAVFELTRDFVDRHRNLLGLVYALHGDGQSVVHPAIPR